MQQSHSAVDIRRKEIARDHSWHSDNGSPPKTEEKLAEIQSGNDWTCMWLNHFKREENAMANRQNKYEKNIHMILSNPSKFGNDYNNINEFKKEQMRATLIGNGWGNEFVPGMSGWPVEKKCTKWGKNKREKLKKIFV